MEKPILHKITGIIVDVRVKTNTTIVTKTTGSGIWANTQVKNYSTHSTELFLKSDDREVVADLPGELPIRIGHKVSLISAFRNTKSTKGLFVGLAVFELGKMWYFLDKKRVNILGVNRLGDFVVLFRILSIPGIISIVLCLRHIPKRLGDFELVSFVESVSSSQFGIHLFSLSFAGICLFGSSFLLEIRRNKRVKYLRRRIKVVAES